MGKFDGKQITGLIGKLVFKRGKDGKTTIIKTQSEEVKQTEGTKEASSVFGKASALAKTIRDDLSALHLHHYDGAMVNRFNTLNREILDHCYDKGTKTFTFKPNSFDRLKGFEFNTKSPLARTLWVNPTVNLQANQLQLDLPEIMISENLKFPISATTCEIRVLFTQIILDQALHSPNIYQSITVEKKQETIPAQSFTFEVPDGCLCVIGMSLYFLEKQRVLVKPVNDKVFNPAAICGAFLTPGTFTLPTQVNPSTGKGPQNWLYLEKLKF